MERAVHDQLRRQRQRHRRVVSRDQVRGRNHCAERSVAIEQFPCADALLLPTPLKVAEDSEAMPDRVTARTEQRPA